MAYSAGALRTAGRALSPGAGAGAPRCRAARHRHRRRGRGLSADVLLHHRRVQRHLRRRDRRHGGDVDGAREPPGRCGPSLRARPVLRSLLRGDGLSRPAAGRRHRLVGAQATSDLATRVLAGIAALAFVAAAVVSAATIAEYWSHPHFIKVRSMSFDFWQNLQFVIPLVGLAICAAAGLAQAGLAAGARAAHRHGHRRRRARVHAVVAAAARTLHSLSAVALSGAPGGGRAAGRCCSPACGSTSPGSESRRWSSPRCGCRRSRGALSLP